jgi:hypothetical protein
MAKREEPRLGDVARDTITGFKGVVITSCDWLHGCRRLTLQPQGLKDKKPVEAQTFDAPQVQMVKRAVFGTTSDTGGPRPEPQRHHNQVK